MEKKIQIEMKDGSKKNLADLVQGDLPNVKLTTKEEETNLTMKTEVISETLTHELTRRLYKWTTMPALAMYDVNVPKTFDVWIAETPHDACHEYGIGNWLIEQDKVHNGMSTGVSKENKELAKLMGKASVDIQAQIRALLEASGVPIEAIPGKITEAKANLQSHGMAGGGKRK